MPVAFRHEGPYRFFIPAGDHRPPHIHVEHDDKEVIFSLRTVQVRDDDNYGFSTQELKEIRKIILDNLTEARETWDRYGGPS